jgi:hypothetical protein
MRGLILAALAVMMAGSDLLASDSTSKHVIVPVNKSSLLPQEQVIRAILGEAEGESYLGKVALSFAILNRGTMKGVYGYKTISLRSGAYYRGDRRLNEKVVEDARKALKWAILHPEADITNGARHWENIKAFGEPYWAKGKQPSLVIGNHAFYAGIK